MIRAIHFKFTKPLVIQAQLNLIGYSPPIMFARCLKRLLLLIACLLAATSTHAQQTAGQFKPTSPATILQQVQPSPNASLPTQTTWQHQLEEFFPTEFKSLITTPVSTIPTLIEPNPIPATAAGVTTHPEEFQTVPATVLGVSPAEKVQLIPSLAEPETNSSPTAIPTTATEMIHQLENPPAPSEPPAILSQSAPLRRRFCDPYCTGLCCTDPNRRLGWARVELLSWWVRGYDTPPLLTASPSGTPPGNIGVLGLSTTSVLFGGNDFADDLRLGARYTGGRWLDAGRQSGWQVDYFGLGKNGGQTTYDASSGILARPFFNTNPAINAQDAQIINLPGEFAGSIVFDTANRILSAAPAYRWNGKCCSSAGGCCSDRAYRLDFTVGYRFMQFNEQFRSTENVVVTGSSSGVVMGSSYTLDDLIDAQNQFHGIEFGAIWMRQRSRLTWEIAGLLAAGGVQQLLRLDGSTTIGVPTLPDRTVPGGFLIPADEVGSYTAHQFAWMPQVRANIGYCLGRNLQLTTGYSFLYLGSVVRPGTYMNTRLNGSNIGLPPTGAPSSITSLQDEPTWLQGLSFGLTYNF